MIKKQVMFKSMYFLICLSFVMGSCSGQSNNDNPTSKNPRRDNDAISGFDVSDSSKKVLYSLFHNGNTQIIIKDLKSDTENVILQSPVDKVYYTPRFSTDEKQILFIEHERGKMETSKLYVANADGTNKKVLIENRGIISEAIFSDYYPKIYFTMANEYDNYSPLARKAAHGYDIFSYGINSMETEKLTDLNAYGIHHLFELDSANFLAVIQDGPAGGMFLINKLDQEERERIVPANDPRGAADLYYTPIYSKEYDKMVFTAPYELYIMDVKDKEAKSLHKTHPETISYVRFVPKEEKIIFTRTNDPSLYTIKFDGTGLKEISLKR